jgi:hypothetical protein
MTTRTPAQQIAELEAKIARLKTKDRALENGQKIILGGMLISAARTDQRIRKWVLTEAAKITRPADVKRLAPLLEELKGNEWNEPDSGATKIKPTGGDATQFGAPGLKGAEPQGATQFGGAGLKGG